MRRVKPWVVLVVLAAAVGIGAAVSRSPSDSADHSANSDGIHGTSALLQLAGRMGHSTHLIEGDFSLPRGGLLFVFSPDSPFTDPQAALVRSWVEAGGILVYATGFPDPALDRALNIGWSATSGAASRAAGPLLPGVGRVAGPHRLSLESKPTLVPLLREGNSVVGARESLGRGAVIGLANPNALSNGWIKEADNPVFAADLIALASTRSPVSFDEFHHGLQSGNSVLYPFYAFTWGRAIAWAALVLLGGLALRGRSLGARIPLLPAEPRSMREHTRAAGRLLAESGARTETVQGLIEASRRALARRVGLHIDPTRSDFHRLLAARDPETAGELARIEADSASAAADDASVAAIAAALHGLVYPGQAR